MTKPKKPRSHRRSPIYPRLREKEGLASEIAKELGVSRQAVWMWGRKGGRVPAEYVRRVSELLDMPKHQIRPDIYQEG